MAEQCREPPDRRGGNSTSYPGWMLGPDDLGETRILLMRAKPKPDKKGEERLPSKPFMIAQTIQLTVGYHEASKIHTTKEGQGSRYVFRTSSKSISEKLMGIKTLLDDTEVEVIPHPSLSFVEGVLFDHDTIDEDESFILEQLKSQGVTKVRRIIKKIGEKRKNTPLLILTFQASKRPEYIFIGMIRSKIRPYYPSPMICFRCAEYGHGKNKCPTENPVCLKCSKMHTLEENETCQNDPYCLHCQGNHFPMARDCPKYKEEAAIIKLKVDQGLSFGEARTIFRDSMRNTTFKSIVQQRLSTEVDEKDRTIQILREELAAVKNELRKLQETVTQKSNMVSTDMIRSKQSSNKTRSSSPRALSISPTTDSIMKPSGSDKTTEQSPRLSRIDSKGSYTSNRSYQQKANPQHNRNLSKKRTTTPPKLNAKKGKTNGPPLSCGPSPMEQ
ncbi:uncharacterized protein LOC129759439 [Uranotaenia lowii]|uniref:uncharacterized protein LOC129759439 n=1 Tax=Uranotaenia lowii TaxID=190385 RepID=UPI00247A2192|nr:uncharacterized protein LOC129759439 [Uranotaenia lowii]